jgi:RimJ/RimL family protein N-acetyltransferase
LPTFPPLVTERLSVRPLALDDLEQCHRLYLDIGWHDAQLDDHANRSARSTWLTWSIANYRELAALNQPPYGERAIERREDGAFVGLVGLVPSLAAFGQLPAFGGRDDRRTRPEVGLFWAVSPRWQRRGYATEAASAFASHALQMLRLERIVATTDRQNRASIGVMKRLGMNILENTHPDSEWPQIVGMLEA